MFVKEFGFSLLNRLGSVHETELLSSELFSIEQLKRHAVMLAESHTLDLHPGPDRLLPRLADNERVIWAAYDIVTAAVAPGQRIFPAESWLLDNFYLIEQQINQARRHLPRGYSRQLPRLKNGSSGGFPRIYELALQLISHMDGRIDKDNVTQFIAAYQTVEPLKLGELWAFPIMLQLALLENIRRVALRIARRREELDAASKWADRMLVIAEKDPKHLIQLLAEFANADVPLTAPFVEEFYARLQAHGTTIAFVQAWVEQKLSEQGVTATQLSEAAGRTAAANQLSIANSIGSLRFIDTMNWRDYVESLSIVEDILSEDPAGVHKLQDFATRDRYRHIIEDLARNSAKAELAVAREVIALARAAADQFGTGNRTAHVGYYLIDDGRLTLEHALEYRLPLGARICRVCRQYSLCLYLGVIGLITVLATALAMSALDIGPGDWRFWFFTFTGLIGASAMAVTLVNMLITLILPPRPLPRLDFSDGIPPTHRTMVVVPTLLSTQQDVDKLLEALEIRYLGNRDPNLFFALLTDFRDAPQHTLPTDDALLEYARKAVNSLNATYHEDRPNIFYLFHRPRVWNSYEKVWMGYERKRGKLEQFNALLRGEAKNAFSDIVGDPSILESIRYVITLDTDTQLPRESAWPLIGNMAHPLNRPVYDPDRGRIIEGYAILQPRVSISLISASQSRFTAWFAGESGIDPYTREVSDVYQDIFGEGSFVGKGIYDVNAFRQAIDGRFPENLILSHDLLESGYARSALVTDVDLIEEHPASYAIESSRRHRWIRGDWQLVGWMFSHVSGPAGANGSKARRQPNPLTALSIWKIFDNLRRSLVAPALLALLIGGWLLGPGPAWLWMVWVAGIVFLPILLGAAIQFIRKPAERDWWVHLNLTSKSTAHPLILAALTLTLLPYDTRINLGAILYSGLRMLFTRRGLMLWHLPAYTRRNASTTLFDFVLEMWTAPALAIVLGYVLMSNTSAESVFYAPVLLAWLLSPVVGWWISKPLVTPEPQLTADQRLFLRTSARRTWRFFAQFVGPDDHWLPPDNFQEHPSPIIATRTSPTNIGMSLLAHLAAHDFGYISTDEFLQRIGKTVETMEKLERYLGHFYNWYDTRTLQPLHPQYVSSVDSGNLIGSLLTLQAGLAELKDQPIISMNIFHGLQDTLRILGEHIPASPNSELARKVEALERNVQLLTIHEPAQKAWATIDHLLAEILRISDETMACLPADIDIDGELYYWARAFNQQVSGFQQDFRHLMVESHHHFDTIPTLAELVIETSIDRTAEATVKASRIAVQRIEVIDSLIDRCGKLARMDFEFLYDTSRDLLAIGYDVGERRRDQACYDLLASEARLASFLLIAQGQLPQKHWYSLGRLLTSHGGDISLISWSGSMFEYLMPRLIMPSYENTLLEQTCKAAVLRQVEYGEQRNVPWGISESCYNATDVQQIYQYRAFGVPGLGFKRGLGDDLVIAPYASALALTVMPQVACNNLQTLAAIGLVGAYGFYEAADYTPSRVPRGKACVTVRTFMAHHQGMSLLALEQVLLNSPMQRRFMSDPLIQATALLLQERVPKKGATLHPHAAEVTAAARPAIAESGTIMRVFTDLNTPIPEVHLLSNGRYHVMATHAGGGYSRWHDIAITRWREDATCDSWGTFIYLRDQESGRYWSTAYQPTVQKADHYEAIFVQARAEYRRRDYAIETHTEISVSPEDDVEIRRVTLTNQSFRTRHIEITTYAEVVLAPLNSDLAHRAFSNLFVQTEIIPDRHAILATRRRRMPNEQIPWMFHLLAAPGVMIDESSYETDRAKFIGRGRTVANPAALTANSRQSLLSNTDGSVLDPIMAIRRTITLMPNESATVQIISGIASTREAALMLLENYCDRHFVDRAFEMAWFHSQEVLRSLNATETDAQMYGRLASSVIFSTLFRRTAPSIIARNQLGQAGLWRFAISGDLPIILIRIGNLNRIELIRQALQAHAYWRMKGLASDLVIVNEDFSGYRAVLHDQIIGLINAGSEAQIIDKPGGVFVRRTEELSEDERVLLQTVARIVFSDTADTLIEPLERRMSSQRIADLLEPRLLPVPEPVFPPPKRERLFYNGFGGFTLDGREYVITLDSGVNTPAPWANVIASPHIGMVVSERGSAYTWVNNAHEFRLTPWHNDPISDTSGEMFYLRDEDTGVFWSPMPLLTSSPHGYVCRHGFGYSAFEHSQVGISSELYTYVSMDAPVKFVVIKLRNDSKRPRRMSLTGYFELVLGEWRHTNIMHIVTEMDPHSGALFARNAYSREYAKRIVFAKVSEKERSVTGNRTEFIGRNGSLSNPMAMRRKRLSGKTGAGLDPCAAIQTHIDLAEGQEREIVFIFGAAHDTDEAQHFIQQYGGVSGARQALEAVWGYWNHTLGAVHVETPEPALDVLVNGWLIYQTLSCRLWGRSGYYQSGGAYGFRDQLQDSMALVHATPWLVREHLIRCAERQFPQGDVQHWWHPPNGQGVRTHFSDDYLWLPYVTYHYVRTTGDTGILDEPIHFLEGRELYPEEEAYYDQPQRSGESASLYEHCVRAIKHGLRFGQHQLPLMGCGDWNDGMNLVGQDGKGESVWLAWFLYTNLHLFADLAQNRGDDAFAQICNEQAKQLQRHVENNAWDGGWYKRAYFDDGTPLGSSSNDECQIDSISQSWAVISKGGDSARARQAMNAVDKYLVRRDKKLIQLFDPPFDKSALEPGYIKGYVPGIRENGGQYTHAAIWSTMAFALLGDRERAWELFAILNPVNHGRTPAEIERYKVEPYVMSADIYAIEPHIGRGGWTWYTGAAGWMYRLSVETLLGLHLEVDHLRITPRIPDQWRSYLVHYRFRETFYHITIRNNKEKSQRENLLILDGITVDNVNINETGQPLYRLPLINDHQQHYVEIIL
ncbi:cyclic beta 1-2 glucan synthetase [Nitrosomonas sp. JL21]|uniref:GH36-type glycosyl hydrolase domain-containing protein n=1 Tax=Nitrosomonas sp. JL21 TaxID=153949 RepID=UPI001369A3EE|nr:glucoamylase family protein [Nitrosomonas sp. JL21]MBL8497740.1 cyclic beta 1-2 glucan synthetase [Nitrosomonas sp.]MXS78316.1 cyclic beta 1-2 glucan synthetase [Nitrosomonas sp. JL21]